jgi:hypothetical protein
MKRQCHLVFRAFAVLALLSCDQREGSDKRAIATDKTHSEQAFSQTPAATHREQQLSQPLPATHLWNKGDIDTSLKKLSGIAGVITRHNTINIAPLFYKDPVPFSYMDKAVYAPGGMDSPTMDIAIVHEYPSWRTVFIYTSRESVLDEIPDRVQTTDIETGRILAESRRLSIIKGEGIDIEERHYGSSGELIVRCKGRISFGFNQKVQEMDLSGRKQADYYFLFPI